MAPILSGPLEDSTKLALSRFNDACQRVRDDDAIIDFVIALEALLCRGLEAELSYRFALRGAAFIDGAARAAANKLLRDAYRERSRLVHGTIRRPTPALRGDLHTLASTIIIAALRLGGEHGLDHAGLLRSVDAFLLRGDGPGTLQGFLLASKAQPRGG